MKIALAVLAFLFSYSAAYSQTTPALGIRDKTPVLRAFTGATIVVSPEMTLDKGTLLINDGRVVAVGESISIPEGAAIEDLSGLVILPGFIDLYTNYGVPSPRESSRRSRRPKYEADREGGSAWNEAVHADRKWADRFEPDSSESAELMKQGFVAVQSARLDGIFQGQGLVALLGHGLPNDLIIKANSMAFASFNKGSSQQDYPSSLMGSIALVRQSFMDAGWYLAAQSAFSQNSGQKRPEYNSSLEALSDVTTGRQRMLLATEDELSLVRAERIADEFGLKFIELGSGREYALPTELADLDGRLILPVAFPEVPDVTQADDELDYSLRELRHWEWAPSNPALLYEDGVSFAFTSHGIGKTSQFLPNVRAAVKRGLPSKAALAALTTLPAEILGISSQLGSLEPGHLANFVVADANPLESDANIYSTWIIGREYEHIDTESRLLGGDFQTNWPDTLTKLSILVTGAKAKVELGSVDAKLKGWDVEIDYPMIRFAVLIDSILTPGAYRVSGELVNDTVRGFVLSPDGQRMPWQAIRLSASDTDIENPNDTTEKKSWIDEPLVSRHTYPNRGWGPESVPAQETVLIRNATVWTVEEGGIIANCDILVKDGRFTEIGSDLETPAGARVIEAHGRHVTPGLIDEHSHIAISHDVNEGTHAVSAEVRIGDVVDPTDVDIYRQLAGGITCAELLHGSANPIGGESAVIKLRWGSSADDLKFKEAGRFIKFALGENVKQSNWGEAYSVRYPQTRMGVEAIIRDEFTAAREYTQKWDEYKKLGKKEQARTVPPRRDLRMEALRDVLRGDLSIVCHGYVQSEMLMLMRLAEEFGIRVWSFIHVLEGYKIADELAAHGATATAFSDWWAYKFEVYDAIPYAAAIMVNHGVNTTLNSDNNDLARRLNTEAAKTIQYGGLSPEEAIKLVTINSAIQLRAEEHIGSIKVGKDADFVIWNDYPLSIYASPDQTWIEGRLFFDREKDSKIREEILVERAALIQKAVKAASGGNTQSNNNRRGDTEESDYSPGFNGREDDGGVR